jgi:hypothetical protein
MKRVGPELKMPDLKNVKVPGFVADLYHDLADRRLLPLVGLILVAIVATPFLLGQSSEDTAPEAGAPPANPHSVQASSLTVVEAQPGLRDYRRRLSGRKPTDPFRQKYTGAPATGGLPDEATSSTTSTVEGGSNASSTGGSSKPVEPVPSSSSGNSESGTGAETPSDPRLFTFAINVRISSARTNANGKKEKTKPEVREEVVPPAPLPSAKSQAVTYMGISPKTKKPLFLVSDDVEAIYGEPKCISGSEKCQLLEVDLQMPTTFVYGPTNTRFKINVLKVEPVLKGHFKG